MFDVDLIIPCYGNSEIIEKGIASLAIQWHKEYLHVTLVNDCSPNTDCDYQDLVDKYKNFMDIRCIRTPGNGGQGLARQFGIDNTSHEYFMFMDEDDQLGNGVAFSQFVGAVECANFVYDQGGAIICGEDGKPVDKEDAKPVALVSGPLFVFDNNTSYTIDNVNRVWVNSKLYNRSFIRKHNIRFNVEQSRHAEDYFWMSCFFYAVDNDPDYQSILLDNSGIYYLWYPNERSQSRVDPDYGYMLSGYTMGGSVNILKYVRDSRLNGIEWTEEREIRYRGMGPEHDNVFLLYAPVVHQTCGRNRICAQTGTGLVSAAGFLQQAQEKSKKVFSFLYIHREDRAVLRGEKSYGCDVYGTLD